MTQKRLNTAGRDASRAFVVVPMAIDNPQSVLTNRSAS